jgi:hypothetical protein
MEKMSRAVLAGLSMLMVAGAGWGTERGGTGPLPRIWAVNLGSEPMELIVERTQAGAPRTETLVVGPEKMMEVRRSGDEEILIPDRPDLLLVTAPAGFDPASLRVEGAAPGIERPAGRGPSMREKALPERLLKRGEAASASSVWTGAGPLATRVVLHGPMTSAEVRAVRPEGTPLGYVTLAASRDVAVTVDLRGFLDQKRYWGPVRQEVEVRRGTLSTSLDGPIKSGAARGLLKTVGTGSFNYHIQYTIRHPADALYYTVTGGPASVCGELNTYRNGSWLFGPGWFCTNSLGGGSKGPWYTANGNQTDNPSFIRWPNGTATSNDWHIWDNDCPSISYSSAVPPYSWFGTASDGLYGVCFTSTTGIVSRYLDVNTGLYWSASTGAYTSGSAETAGSLSGVPGCAPNWTAPRPPLAAHTPGHTYAWSACISDGGCTACGTTGFTY